MKTQAALHPQDLQFNYRMPPTKIEAFLREFPWVEKFVNGPISQAYVSRIDSGTLGIVPEYGGTAAYLLNSEGKLVVRHSEVFQKKFFFFGPLVRRTYVVKGVAQGKSLRTVIEELGKAADGVRFILFYWESYRAVILYKTPKDMTIKEWVARQIEKEAAQYKNEATAIDTLA